MLIDNKFIYLSLPRRGSTSFHYSCILHGLTIQTLNDWSSVNSNVNFTTIDESTIMDHILHGHDPLIELGKKFGFNYPVIAVKRDRHETFYSLYKHLLFEFKRIGADEFYEYFKNIALDDLFFYKTEEILNKTDRYNIISEYLIDKKLLSNPVKIPSGIKGERININSQEYIMNVIDLLITPSSYWHNNEPNVIWFDMKNLKVMEEWVSNMIQKPFVLKNVNSSKHMESKLELNSDFIERYNNIYDFYDLPKSIKTLI
jgi:hypothetical protein